MMMQMEKGQEMHYSAMKCSRMSMERRRLLNAKCTASRHRKWQEVRLEREQSEKREAQEILELRRKERARLAGYIHSALQNPVKLSAPSNAKAQRGCSKQEKQEKGGHKKPRWNCSVYREERDIDDRIRVVAKAGPPTNHLATAGKITLHPHALRTMNIPRSNPLNSKRKESFESEEHHAASSAHDYSESWTGSAHDAYEHNSAMSCGAIDYSKLELDEDGYYVHGDFQHITPAVDDSEMTVSSITTASSLSAYSNTFASPKVLNLGFSKKAYAEKNTNQDGPCYEKEHEFFEAEAASILDCSQQVFVSRSTSPSNSIANSRNDMACNCASPGEDQRSSGSRGEVADVPDISGTAQGLNREASYLREEIVKARLANEAATARLIAEVTAIQSRLEDCNQPEALDLGDGEEIDTVETDGRSQLTQESERRQKHAPHVAQDECTCSRNDDQGTIKVHNTAMTVQLSNFCRGEEQYNSAVAALTAYCVSPSEEQGYKRARGDQGQINVSNDAMQNWFPNQQLHAHESFKIHTESHISRGKTTEDAHAFSCKETRPLQSKAWEIGWEPQSPLHRKQSPSMHSMPYPAMAPPTAVVTNVQNSQMGQPSLPRLFNMSHQMSRQGNEVGHFRSPPLPQPVSSCEVSRGTAQEMQTKQSVTHHEHARDTSGDRQMTPARATQPSTTISERLRHASEDQQGKPSREAQPRQMGNPRCKESLLPRGPEHESGAKATPSTPGSSAGTRPDEIWMPKQMTFFAVQDQRPPPPLPPREYCAAPRIATGEAPVLSEEEKNILASLEKLDLKLAAVSARISKSACNSVVSDGGNNSTRSAPTVMAPPSTFAGSSLMSLGSRPRKCCVTNPRSPLTPQATRPFKGLQRRMVGLTNNCRLKPEAPQVASERSVPRRSPQLNPRPPFERAGGGDILLHQFPHQCFDDH